MSYFRQQITTRIIPRAQSLNLKRGITLLVGQPDSGLSEYISSLRIHPQFQHMYVFSMNYFEKAVSRDQACQQALVHARNGSVVFLEVTGPPSVAMALRKMEEAGVTQLELATVLETVVTFEKKNGQVFTQVHKVENLLGPGPKNTFVGC